MSKQLPHFSFSKNLAPILLYLHFPQEETKKTAVND